jgi:hypothetical protein
MLALHLLFFVELRDRILHGYPDFTVFYTAATILRQGLAPQLYDERTQYRVQEQFMGSVDSRRGPLPFIHPPFEAVIFVPLAFLHYRDAFVIWDLLNGVALFGVAIILRRRLSALRSISPWEFVLGFLAFFPIFLTLLQGQDSILLLLCCTLAFNALKKDADVLAGCWLAMGAFKFQLVIPLALLLVVWGRKRVGLGFSLVVLALAGVSILAVGRHGLVRYPEYALQIARLPGWGGVPPELMPNLRGLVEGWNLPLSGAFLGSVVLAGSVILLLLAAGWSERVSERTLDLRFSLAVVVTGLVSWHTNAHDLGILILPLAVLANYWCSLPEADRSRRLRLLLPALPLLVSPLWIALWLGVGKLNLLAILLLWWSWEIYRELSKSDYSVAEVMA